MTILLDVVLALVLVEAGALAVFHHLTGRGPRPRSFAANLAAGFFLMLVARLALASPVPVPMLMAALLAALCAHLVDLRGRWSDRQNTAEAGDFFDEARHAKATRPSR